MKSILITGGGGDWAQSFYKQFKDKFKVYTPNRTELDITSESSVDCYFENNSFYMVARRDIVIAHDVFEYVYGFTSVVEI